METKKISNVASITAKEIFDYNKTDKPGDSLHYKNEVSIDKFEENCPACSLLLDAAGALVELWQSKHTKDI